tara:strand:+ start:1747 stop:2304 length:558 start_codon:yes stop_codon:yes gene_type:complete
MFKKYLNSFIGNTLMLKNLSIDETTLQSFLAHDRVVFCTMGKSAFACRKIVYTARSFSLQWHDLDVCHAFHGDAGLINDKDLLVFVSKSGETRETIEVAKYFKNKKIAITSNKESTLNQICNSEIFIEVPSEGSPYGYSPMTSTSSYMIVLHAILCFVIESKKIKLSTFAKNHPAGKIGEELEKK